MAHFTWSELEAFLFGSRPTVLRFSPNAIECFLRAKVSEMEVDKFILIKTSPSVSFHCLVQTYFHSLVQMLWLVNARNANYSLNLYHSIHSSNSAVEWACVKPVISNPQSFSGGLPKTQIHKRKFQEISKIRKFDEQLSLCLFTNRCLEVSLYSKADAKARHHTGIQ